MISLLALGACSLDAPSVQGTTSNTALSVAATAAFHRCDGAPCTGITVDLRRESGEVHGAHVQISVDDAPPEDAIEHDEGYGLGVAGWIHSVRIDVGADGDTAALWSDARLSTPDAAGIALPDRVELGTYPELTWHAQAHATKTIVFSALAPHPPHFGFLATGARDDGHVPLGPSLLDQVGRYEIELLREMNLSDPGDNLYLTWSSEWSAFLDVEMGPPV